MGFAEIRFPVKKELAKAGYNLHIGAIAGMFEPCLSLSQSYLHGL